jgi:hypothetical protein
MLYVTGIILLDFRNNTPSVLESFILNIAWIFSVTGFSVVLWSRLHLVLNDPRIRKRLMVMIVVDGIIFHGVTWGLTLSAIFTPPIEMVSRATTYMYHIEQLGFTLQETILASLYIYYTLQFLRNGHSMHTTRATRLLLSVHALVIALDVITTTLQFKNQVKLASILHGLFYGIKLRFELIVLNQLQTFVKSGSAPVLGSVANTACQESNTCRIPEPEERMSLQATCQPNLLPVTDTTSLPQSLQIEISGSANTPFENDVNRENDTNSDFDLTVQGNEYDLQREFRTSNCAEAANRDLEAFYLGRWDGRMGE